MAYYKLIPPDLGHQVKCLYNGQLPGQGADGFGIDRLFITQLEQEVLP